jgi:hypothetical protein
VVERENHLVVDILFLLGGNRLKDLRPERTKGQINLLSVEESRSICHDLLKKDLSLINTYLIKSSKLLHPKIGKL